MAIEAALEKPSQNPVIVNAAKVPSWQETAIAASHNPPKRCHTLLLLYILHLKIHAFCILKSMHFIR